MGRAQNIRTAKQRIADNRSRSIGQYEAHVAEVSQKIPEFAGIMRQLSGTGAKILAAMTVDSRRNADESAENETADSAVRTVSSRSMLEMVQNEYETLAARKRALLLENGYPADYCDVKFVCEKCSDTGYVGIDICDCLKKELIMASLEASGLYSLVETQSFNTFSLDYYEKDDKIIMKQNARRLWDFAKNFEPGKSESFLFIGATGLGKTHLSSSVARILIERGAYVVYESAISLFGDYEARRFGGSSYTSDEDTDDVDRYIDCDLLIIDDLGCEVTNNFTLSCLYNIVNSRIIKHKSTIINTNLAQNELRKRYTDRIISRIFGEYIPLTFRGMDIREQRLKNQAQL